MDNQVVAPNQNNNQVGQPSNPGLPAQGPSNPGSTTPVPVAGLTGTSFGSNDPAPKSKLGMLSLLISSSAIGIFILLVFVTNLVDSLTKAYLWFFAILVMGILGLALGLLSERGKPRINLLGLVGIILSVIVCVNCLTIGSFYIKTQIELNKVKTQFENADFSDFEYDSNSF